jgi:hypothetical protein
VPQVVDAERQLVAVGGDAAPAGHPGVVDQHVQRLVPGQELLGAAAHRGQIGQVERQERDRVVAGGGRDVRRRSAALIRRPAGQEHPAAPAGQDGHGGPADAGIAPGDQERAPA